MYREISVTLFGGSFYCSTEYHWSMYESHRDISWHGESHHVGILVK
jgi:hypothetical protein